MSPSSTWLFYGAAAASAAWLLALPFLGRTYDRWDRLFEDARRLFKAGQLESSRELMTAAYHLAPRLGRRAPTPRALSALGLAEVALNAGDRTGAERVCREALELARRKRSVAPEIAGDAEALLARIRTP